VTSQDQPLISDSTLVEIAAMEERDRLAGGPPWEVPDHPDNSLPGGWHHGQLWGLPYLDPVTGRPVGDDE